MKKTVVITLIAAALLWVLPSCEPTEDPLAHLTDGVMVTTVDPAFITGYTASCSSEVTANDAGLLLELGVCWSKSATPTIDDFVMKSHKCSQPYVCLLTNLEPSSTYHVRGFAKYGTEYCYGDEKTFTTLADNVPAASPVTTLEAGDITAQSFRAAATVEPFGAIHFSVGICYSTLPDFTIENCEGSEIGYYDHDSGVYQVYCPYLTPNTLYYYRAFVAYNNGSHADPYSSQTGYFYGNVLSLTTPEMPFVLSLETNYLDYSYSGRYIYASGYGECSMPELIDQIGFCYSSANEYPQFESDLHTTAATPTGEWFDFSSYLYNVSANTKYYVRSYARYKTDSIKYGNVRSITTY